MTNDNVDRAALTRKVQESLRSEGFELFGIVKALPHPEDGDHISEWIAGGRNGTMHFLEKNLEKRSDITSLFEGARSVIVAALSYYSDDASAGDDNYFISRYARVRDYHIVIKDKLLRVLKTIQNEIPDATGRVFCDSAPVTEKTWAIRAGLGWRGRNSLVINENSGSFFFLGEIVTSAELVYDNSIVHDHCGACRQCIDACPTAAICDDRTIDAQRCIAYLTIEHDGELPSGLRGKTENIIFGCDRCQEVCPWNKKVRHFTDSELEPGYPITSLTKNEWKHLTPERFDELFRSSPVRRTGFENIKRNILFAEKRLPEEG